MQKAVLASLDWTEAGEALTFAPATGVTGHIQLQSSSENATDVCLRYQAESERCERLQGVIRQAALADSEDCTLEVALEVKVDDRTAFLDVVAPFESQQSLQLKSLHALAEWLVFAVASKLGQGWLLQVHVAKYLQEGVRHIAEIAAASVEPCALVVLDDD